jgi:hypothetical protein
VPLCIDIKPADVKMPLASFQGRPLSEDGVYKLVKDMNAARDNPLDPQQIKRLFTAVWPDLNARLRAALAASRSEEVEEVHRGTEDVMAEVVESVRRIERRMDTLQIERDEGISEKGVQVITDYLVAVMDSIATFDVALQSSTIDLDRDDEVKNAWTQLRKLGRGIHPVENVPALAELSVDIRRLYADVARQATS